MIGTFAVLYFLGFSINTLTLMGLTLAIGLVVDDAIVVLENVTRWVEGGTPPREAARRGMDEISFAVIAATVSMIAVFLPLAFLTDKTGRLFREFMNTGEPPTLGRCPTLTAPCTWWTPAGPRSVGTAARCPTCAPMISLRTSCVRLLDRNVAVPPHSINDVVIGAANQAGEDNRNVARMAVLLAGLPMSVPGATVNRLCGSGLDAVNRAAADLVLGHGDVAVAGGVEVMSRAPFVLPRATDRLPRTQELVDTALGWRLVNPAMPVEHTISLGMTAEVLAAEYGIDREAQDVFALESHRKAVAAQDSELFDAELVAVLVGDTEVTADEGPRADTSLERLAKLKPVFTSDGTGHRGQLQPAQRWSGGGAARQRRRHRPSRTDADRADRHVGRGRGRAAAHGHRPGARPAARPRAAGWKLDELEVVELNEAFAAQSLAVMAELDVDGLDSSRVNPLGGAIALGHPLGCSGARILTTLVHHLSTRPSGTRGAATMCIGVGQGIATLVERV